MSTSPSTTPGPPAAVARDSDVRSVSTPLRWILVGALIVLVDVTYSETVDGVGWRFDFLNDAVGMLMILWGTSRLAGIQVHGQYRVAMRFVVITAVLGLLDAIHGHFIYDTLPAVALFFALVNVASIIATVVFCVAMRWLSEASNLVRSAASWKVTTWLFVIVCLIPLGGFFGASAVAIAIGKPFNIDLGPAGLLAVPVLCIPLVHFFISTRRMTADARSPAQPPVRHEPRATRTRPFAAIVVVAAVVAVVGLFALLFYRSHQQPPNPVTATVAVGDQPNAVAVDPAARTVYVVNSENDTMSVIDATTYTVRATVPVGDYPMSVAVDPGTHTVYVANAHDDTVSVIDGATQQVTATVPMGPDASPATVAVDPDTHTAYVATYHAGTVSAIDGSTHAVTTAEVGNRQLNGMATDPGTGTVYVSSLWGKLLAIDGSTLTVTDTMDIDPPGEVLFHPLTVDPATHTVYLTNTTDDTVSVIEGSTLAVTTTVDAGRFPNGAAVDPGTRTLYVLNSVDDAMSVIDGATNRVTETVKVGRWPAALAVDPGTHTVFVANNGDDTVSVIERTAPGQPRAVGDLGRQLDSTHWGVEIG